MCKTERPVIILNKIIITIKNYCSQHMNNFTSCMGNKFYPEKTTYLFSMSFCFLTF